MKLHTASNKCRNANISHPSEVRVGQTPSAGQIKSLIRQASDKLSTEGNKATFQPHFFPRQD